MCPHPDIRTYNFLYCDYIINKKKIPVRTINFEKYHTLAQNNGVTVPKYQWDKPNLINVELACSPLLVIQFLPKFKLSKNNPNVWKKVTDETWTKRHYESCAKIDEKGLPIICYYVLSYVIICLIYFIFSRK